MEKFKKITGEVLDCIGKAAVMTGSVMVITEMIGNIVVLLKNPNCGGMKLVPVYAKSKEE